jgi:hypothetical protein
MDNPSPERLTPGETPISAWFNPADYFTFVLDQEIRKAGLPGGYCGFMLELGDVPDLPVLQARLDLLAERFPVATARPERRGKRYGWVRTGRRLALECHLCPPGEDGAAFCRRTVSDILNRPAPLESALPLSLHWVGHDAGGVLMLHWLHPLLDARGGKILFDFLASGDTGRFVESPPLVGRKLSEWSLWKKIGLFLKAKRHNGAANRLDSCLPTRTEEHEAGAQTLCLRVRRFDAGDSAKIARLAQQATGLAGKTLYYLGCLMRALESVGPPVAKQGYCIPYAYNLRRQNAPTPVFGNHVGCLFAQATREQVRDRAGLFGHLLAQHRRTVQAELDVAYLPLMWLGQWLSPGRYATLLRKQHSGGELSSCWFSDIGELRWSGEGFLGAPVLGLFHATWMTLPPGLALLVGRANGQLTLSFNYLRPAVDEDWLDRVVAIMDAELLGETG